MLSAIIASADNRKYARKPRCRNAANETGAAGAGEEAAFMDVLVDFRSSEGAPCPPQAEHDESGNTGDVGALVDVNAYDAPPRGTRGACYDARARAARRSRSRSRSRRLKHEGHEGHAGHEGH